jgi:hypothetical protein
MRTFGRAVLFVLGVCAWSAAAVAAPDGSHQASGPAIQSVSTQEVLFHYVPSGECLDGFVAGTTLRHAAPAPPFSAGNIQVPAAVASSPVYAQLFWVILADTEQPPTEMLNGVPLARIPLGPVTPSPCWAEGHAFAYRADVLGIIRAGANTLTGFPDSGTFNVSPESEGASLVVAYHSAGVDKEIIVMGGNDAVPVVTGTATVSLPVVTAAGTGAELYFIGADGQSPPPAFADEAYWNSGALDNGDAWQGLDPGAGTGEWDTMEFGVTVGAPNEAATTSFGDCLNWVATVLKVKSGGCVRVGVEPQSWGNVKGLYR